MGECFYVVGISHNSVSAQDMSPYCLDSAEIQELYQNLPQKNCSGKTLILSTCNRVEIYGLSDDIDSAFESAKNIISQGKKDMTNFEKFCYKKSGREALAHLFSVASGLDSQMIGETEIFGQVKQAYEIAASKTILTSDIHLAFQKAIQTAKWIRSNTFVGRGKISIGSVSADLAIRIFESLKEVKILLIGSGDAGEIVAEALKLRGANNITIANRTWENALKLSLKIRTAALPIEIALEDIEKFDIIIAATSAQTPIITANMMQKSVSLRSDNPQFIIDLGVPNNVSEDVEKIENVFSYDLQNLSKIANENLESRKSEIALANAEIDRKSALVWERFLKKSKADSH